MSAKLPKQALMMMVAVATVAMAIPAAADGRKPETRPVVHELTTFAAPGCVGGCGSGSAIGPDKALYVSDGPGGRVLRVNPKTGATTTYASGLPPTIPDVGIGGAIDVAFVGDTAYVLVTLVGPAFGQPDVVNGIYRIEKDGSATAIADLGAWSIAHPPATDFFMPERRPVRVAEVPWRVAGHRRSPQPCAARLPARPYPRVGRVRKHRPHGPRDPRPHDRHGRGRPHSASPRERQGHPLHAQVTRHADRLRSEPDRRRRVRPPPGAVRPLARRLGSAPDPENEGKPAAPDTGRLLRVKRDGSFAPVVEGLDRPTSLEFIDDTAFVVTLTGKVLRIDGVSRPHGSA